MRCGGHRTFCASSIEENAFAASNAKIAEPRLVVIRGAQEAVKDLATALTSYVADPVEGVTLVLHHAGGARNKPIADAMTKAGATIVVCNKITKPAERIDFVRAEIRRRKFFSTGAACRDARKKLPGA